MARRASYEVLIDWDNDGGLSLGDFEASVEGWEGRPVPPPPPVPITAASVRAVATATSSSTSFTCAAPAGLAAGDLVLAVQSADLGAASALTTPTGGAAWAQLGSTMTGGTGQLHTKVWWKVAGGSEPATYGFAQGAGARSAVTVVAVQGADTALTPVIGAGSMAAASPVPSPGVVPTHADDLELRWAAAQYPATATAFVSEYGSTWSASWYGFGKRAGSRAYQGNSGLGDGTGDQYGKIGFPYATMQTDLASSTITKVELRMSNEHAWYNSGLTGRFGTHNDTTEPGGSSSTGGSFNRTAIAFNKGQTKWVTLPNAVGQEFRDNTTKGITTGRTTAGSRDDYGYWRGATASTAQRPRLRISYTKTGQPTAPLTAPAGFVQQAALSSSGFTSGTLATRQLTTAEPTGIFEFTSPYPITRGHALTIAIASPQAAPTVGEYPPELSSSAVRSHAGSRSLLVDWVSSSPSQQAKRTLTGLRPGRAYTARAWVWVPPGSPAVRLGVTGVATSAATATTGAWERVTLPFTAAAAEHVLAVTPATAASAGQQVWVDQVEVLAADEDVTGRTLGVRTPIGFSYGRDTARSLAAIAPADTDLEINNASRDYSPDNAGSPLHGMVGPGRPVLIRAAHGGRDYTLLRGFLDTFELAPGRAARSAKLGVLDGLARLREAAVSTTLYPSLRTGEAIHVVLDAIGWPAGMRDIDPGATTCRWWWAESDDAFDVVANLVNSEGPGAFCYMDAGGKMVFRDRHHRIMRPASTTEQAVFSADGPEPTFFDFTYDIGWSEIANTVNIAVPERIPGPRGPVWESDDTIALAPGEVRTIAAEASEPFLRARVPLGGVSIASAESEIIEPPDADYVVVSGSVQVSLSRTSGQSAAITLRAGASGATLSGLRLWATPVPVGRTVQVQAADEASVAAHGVRTYDEEMPYAGVHDVADVARLILTQRSERLPVISITVKNASEARMGQILSRDLSDRVRIVEPETSTDHPHFIERIEHDITQVGHDHSATFGCERIREQYASAFTFDDPARGFDDGVFGLSGIDEPDTVFVLDESLLGTGLLGH